MAITTRDGHTQTVLSEINMVPFIDIVLVLLIIFMITAPVIQSGIDVTLPRTRTVQALTERRAVITIDKKQTVYLNDAAIKLDQLVPRIRQMVPDAENQTVYLRSDAAVPYGTISSVMDQLKLGGIDGIALVTRPYETRGGK